MAYKEKLDSMQNVVMKIYMQRGLMNYDTFKENKDNLSSLGQTVEILDTIENNTILRKTLGRKKTVRRAKESLDNLSVLYNGLYEGVY